MGDKQPPTRVVRMSSLRRRVGEAEAIYQILRVASAELKQEPVAEGFDEVVTPLPNGWQHIVRVKR